MPLIGLQHSSITEHTQKELLVKTNSGWLKVAPQHETKKWWANIDIKAVALRWIQFAQMKPKDVERHKQLAYDYGQSFMGYNVYNSYIAPFFESFEFNEASHEGINLRNLMDNWLIAGLIDK